MIRLSKSIVGQQEVDAVTKVILEDGYLGMGSEVQNFEKDLAIFLGVKPSSVVCVNSGTAALHLAVQATINPGDEILVPSFTFISTYQAISATGAIPISCDIDENTLLIDINDAEKKITTKTRAIMPVFYGSNPSCSFDVYNFASKYKLRVIEDAAHAFGCKFGTKLIGSFGDITCFSFDGIKNITSGEGGAIITNDEIVLSSIKDNRLLGVVKDTEKRFSGQRSWDFDVINQGYRYHMSNIFAAIGRAQLQRFNTEFAPKRIALAEEYLKLLSSCKELILPYYTEDVTIIPHIFPVRVLNGKRNLLRDWLNSKDVQTGIHYKPNHLLSFYDGGKINLPVTERIYHQILSLPLHPELQKEDIHYICELIFKFYK